MFVVVPRPDNDNDTDTVTEYQTGQVSTCTYVPNKNK